MNLFSKPNNTPTPPPAPQGSGSDMSYGQDSLEYSDAQINSVATTGIIRDTRGGAVDPYTRAQGKMASKRRLRLQFGLLTLALIIAGVLVLVAHQRVSDKDLTTSKGTDASQRYGSLSIPLGDLADAGSISIQGAHVLSVNGQLNVNNSLVLSPTSQPSTGVAGQLYFDQTVNKLEYYDGTKFTPLLGGDLSSLTVTSIGGNQGAFTTGDGIAVANDQISNTGVLSLQGQAGNLSLTAGNGVTVDGLTLSNSGVLSLGGQNGAISVGSGLSAAGGSLSNTGIVSAAAGSGITVTNDGNGNITISNVASGGGTISSPGGTTGKLAVFTGVQTIADSLLSESGSAVTVSGDLSVTGALTLGTALSVGNGGTGSGTAGGARTNLGAAASGANSDITSLSGLTTALSVAQGGIGIGTLATNGVIVGNGSSPLSSVVAGASGLCLLSTAGAPTWGACPGGGTAVTSLDGLTGALLLNNSSGSGASITIDNALADGTTKGIAAFNATNFQDDGSGVINTIQDISTAATPTFAGLTLTGVLQGTSSTLSSTLTVQGAGGVTIGVAGTTPGVLNIANGGNSQLSMLQALAPSGAGNVTFDLPTAAGGTTQTICTIQLGNCAGTGNGVTTVGGTNGKLAKFTGPQTIADSIITDNGATVTVSGDLSVTGTLTLGTALSIGNGGTGSGTAGGARTNLGAAASGANSDITALSGLTTPLSVGQGGTGANTLAANGILVGNGTGAITAVAAGGAGLCLVSTAGAPTWTACPGGGGSVTSLNGLTGALTLDNASAAGSNITIDNAKADGSTKGIAAFNGTNFQDDGSGVINTIQDIAVTSTPTFGGLTLTNPLTIGNGGTGSATATGARTNLGAAASGANSDITSLSGLTTALSVGQGGTGTNTFTSNGLVYGNGSGALQVTAAGTGGQVLMANASGVPTFMSFTGDVTVSNTGVTTIGAGKVTNADLANSSLTVTASTGLTGGGSVALGSSTNLSVLYGALAGNAVQGNTTLVCPSGTGNLSGGGNSITLGSGGSCNNLTITNSPTFSGTLSVQGAGGATFGVAGTTAGVLNIANSTNSQLSLLQANAPTGTGNVTFNLPSAAGGTTQTICTIELGNCAGSGTGLTGSGTNTHIAKFNGSGSLTDSGLTESGSALTYSGNLSIQGSNSLLLGSASGNDGSATFFNAVGTHTVTLQAPASDPASDLTFKLPNSYGSNGDCLQSNGLGGLTFTSCTGGAGGGVTSVNGLTGVISLANASGTGATVTIDDAKADGSTKGIAAFNATNFTDASGVINTVQNIDSGATPTFAGLNLTAPLSIANGGTSSGTAGGARSNLGAAASGANSDITALSGLTTALSVGQGGTGTNTLAANGILVGNGTGAITAVAAGGAGLCLVSTAGAPTWSACPGGGGSVTSLNGLTGALSIANASAAGATITIDDAKADGSTKGIAAFNATNFTDNGSGVINTVQNINSTATPTFGGLTLTGTLQGTSETLSSTLTVQGAGGITAGVAGTTAGVINIANGTNSQLSILQSQAPSGTGNVTYNLPTAAGGTTQTICTLQLANCAGAGGGVTTSGGTTNTLAKFSGSTTIADSIITDNGSTVTVGGDLSVTGNVSLTHALTVANGGTGAITAAAARTNLSAAASGANSDITSLSGLTTALSVSQGGIGINTLAANGVLLGNGTSAITAVVAGGSGLCLVSTAGAPIWTTCPGSGGVTSVDGQTGVITINNTSGTGGVITIDNAKADGSTKGIATFSSSNFADNGSGLVSIKTGGVTTTEIADNTIANADLAGGTYTAITGTGALAAGSIASGFGTISTGNNITTTAAVQGSTGTFTGAGSLTLGNSSNSGSIKFNSSLAAGSVTLSLNNPGTNNFTLNIPTLTNNDTICTVILNNCTGSGATSVGALDQTGVGLPSANGAVIAAGTLYLQSASASFAGLVNTTTQTLAGDKTLSGNTTLNNTTIAAGKSITITGGITGTRPSSPAAGMLYYDTTTNQLLQWNGSKWVSDHTTATKIVAASNSSQAAKDAADFVATGTNDETTIASAVTALPASGGTVYLLVGTYNVGANLNITKAGTTLTGDGGGTVIINRAFNGSTLANGSLIKVSANNVSIRNLSFQGNSGTFTNAFNNAIYKSITSAELTVDSTSILSVSGSAIYLDGDGTLASIANSITNNYINTTGQNGVYDHIGITTTISNNTILSNGVDAIFADQSDYGVISGNKLSSGVNGIVLGANNTAVTNNNINNETGTGILVNNSQQSDAITGNTVSYNGTNGITLTGGDEDITISGNNASGNTGYGIGANFGSPGGDITINGNTVTGNSLQGIYVNDAASSVISGNSLYDNGGTGASNSIQITDATSVSVTSNVITDTAGTGSAIGINAGATNTYLASNRYSGTGATTISDASTSTVYGGQSTGTGGADITLQAANSGNLILDSASGGTVNVGRTNATSVNIGSSTAISTITLNNSTTGGALVNNGSTLNTARALSDFNYSGTGNSGTFGSAATTVDIYTSFTVNQNATTGQTLVLQSPTNTTAGRIIYVANIGTHAFTIAGNVISPGTNATFFWNGTAWTATAVSTGVTLVGSFTGASIANGASISGNTITFGAADATNPGLVTTSGTQIFAGTKQFNGNVTFGASAGSGTVFTNNGATVNTTLVKTDFATGGSIGTAATTVDVYTSISIAQTTANQTLTIPNPTANTAYGRMLYISNVGSASFILSGTPNNNLGLPLKAHTSTSLVWSNTAGGASWQYAGADGNSILNQNSVTQTANFNISGTGVAGNLQVASGGAFDSSTASGIINIGNTNATTINIGQNSGATITNISGPVTLAGNNVTTYTTPAGNSTDAVFGIATSNPGFQNSIMALGLLGGATPSDNADHGLIVYDGRVSGYHAATIAVASPDENNTVGISWDGSNTTASLETEQQTGVNSSNLTLQSGIVTGGNFFATGNVTLASGDYNGFGGVSGDVIIQTGSGAINRSSSGNISIDTGAHGVNVGDVSGNVSIGTTNAPNITIGNTTAASGASAVTLQSGTGGLNLLTDGGASSTTGTIVQSITNNSVAAFNILNKDGNSILQANTTSPNVTIGGDTTASLTVNTSFAFGSLTVQDDGVNGAPNAYLRGTGGKTSDYLDIADNTNFFLLSIGATGATTFRNNANSAAAFRIQNAGGAALINADTSTNTVTVATTASGGVFINNGATLNTSKALPDFAANGALGTAAATVDTYTSFTINQTTGAGARALTIPNPTNTAAGRTIYISNIGTATFTIGGVSLATGTNASFLWNGSAWASTAVSTGASVVGAISGTANTNGATITGNTLNLTAADGTHGGALTSGAQTIGGAKTFSALITGNAGISTSGGAVTLQGNVASSLTTTSGALSLDAAAAVNIGTTNATGITLGSASSTGTITIGQSTASNTISIGNANISANIQTINIGTGSSSTGKDLVTIGSLNDGSATTIQGGSGSITLSVSSTNSIILTGNAAAGTITFTSNGGLVAAGTARHTKKIKLPAEFTGAVLDAASDTGGANPCSTNNSGTMTSGYDNSSSRMNYYQWTSASSSPSQCYDVVVQVPIPSDFDGWTSAPDIQLKKNATGTGSYAIQIIDSTNTTDSNYNYSSPGTLTTSWGNMATSAFGNNLGTNGTTSYVPGDYFTIKVRMGSLSNANVYLGNITLTYNSKF